MGIQSLGFGGSSAGGASSLPVGFQGSIPVFSSQADLPAGANPGDQAFVISDLFEFNGTTNMWELSQANSSTLQSQNLFKGTLTNGGSWDFGSYADLEALQAAGFEKLHMTVATGHTATGIWRDWIHSEVFIADVLVESLANAIPRRILHYFDGANSVSMNMTNSSSGTLSLGGGAYAPADALVTVTGVRSAPVSSTSVGTFLPDKEIGTDLNGPAGMTETDGLLPLIDGYTVVGGVATYPKFAAKIPSFVVGGDLVVPTGFSGAVVRNLGGNAAGFMTPQADATAPNGLNVVSRFNRGENTSANGGAFRLTGAGSEINVNGVITGDPETRMQNFGMQKYLKLDNYISTSSVSALSNELTQKGLSTGGGTLRTILLPEPFANTDYLVFTTSDIGTSAPPTDGAAREATVGNKTTTSFVIRASNGTNIDFAWMAIGDRA